MEIRLKWLGFFSALQNSLQMCLLGYAKPTSAWIGMPRNKSSWLYKTISNKHSCILGYDYFMTSYFHNFFLSLKIIFMWHWNEGFQRGMPLARVLWSCRLLLQLCWFCNMPYHRICWCVFCQHLDTSGEQTWNCDEKALGDRTHRDPSRTRCNTTTTAVNISSNVNKNKRYINSNEAMVNTFLHWWILCSQL